MKAIKNKPKKYIKRTSIRSVCTSGCAYSSPKKRDTQDLLNADIDVNFYITFDSKPLKKRK
ncbi:hypothetical protein AA18889_1575 [Acetobacter senegalensis DSM 18889]|nr:hypothetical protein AA18889_1575 [Acetobacter senegalensis DSM 18889]